MLFKKKNSLLEENVAKQGIKKMDRVVTGLLLGGIIASIYGVKKLRQNNDERQEHHHDSEHHETPHDDHHTEQSHDSGHHETPHDAPREKKKQSLLSRIFFGNK